MTNDLADQKTQNSSAYVLSGLLIALGATLLVGGMRLIALHGSAYYVLAGFIYVVSGVLVWRGNIWGARLYAALLIATLAWSLSEAGLTPWSLLPRLALPAALGLWFLALGRRREPNQNKTATTCPFNLAGSMGLLCFAAISVAFVSPPQALSTASLFSFENIAAMADVQGEASADWPNYGNTLRGTRFSPLTQITPENVSHLQVAWTFRSGETQNPITSAEATPLKVGDTIYTCTPHDVVIALDAESGAQRWRYDPHVGAATYFILTCRGVAYYHSAERRDACADRIILATMDERLLAIDAKSGKLCDDFGDRGTVSLREGMGQMLPHYQSQTSPPTIVKDHIVVGALVLDNQSVDMPSGTIRSFDPVTGRLQWAWDMGAPDRIGLPPVGQTYTRSTPNSWTVFAADEDLGLIYIPTGNPSPDFYGAGRRPFDEKFGSSIVALEIETGRPRWSFQTVHHDLWDYDLAAQPVLTNLDTPEGIKPALVQATKRGDIYVLDRRTGVPIVPVAERAVPQGAVPGEQLSRTQPFSGLALPSPLLTEASMWGLTPIDQMMCRIAYRESRYTGMFMPPGITPSIIMPGLTGMVNWGGVSIDPGHQVVIANYMIFPWRGHLVPRAAVPKAMAASPYTSLMRGTPYAWEQGPWLGPLGVPCSQPPWGALAAIDLSTNRVLWNEPLGTGHDSGPMGIPSMLPLTMGMPSFGGTVTTRSGLVFISGTMDRYLRAIDLRTGRELWKTRLPAGGQATPMTYSAGGRQYVVVTAGGHSIMGTKFGDYTIAYALPAR